MRDKIKTIAEHVDKRDTYSADLDQALAVAGLGWYNVKYCLVLVVFLVATIVEPVGYSFVLPAAQCDLNLSDSQRGFIASIPYIGIVVSSFPWGYLVDTQGRKKVLIISSFGAGILGMASAFMPNTITFAICKMLTSLCIACPAAAPYPYIAEILPAKYRDLVLSLTNAMQVIGQALVPLFAWAILPLDFAVDFGSYTFRAWRVLTIIYASLFIIGSVLMLYGPESPKYLVTQGRYDEALEVLQVIYVGNTKKSRYDFPIKKLAEIQTNVKKGNLLNSLKLQSLPLIQPPYLKWMCLNGFLMFGLFTVLNGLNLWVPDVLNRAMSVGAEGKTACNIISDGLNQTVEGDPVCIDTIDEMTYLINSVATIGCGLIAFAICFTIKFIGKKNLLHIMFWLIGTICILINFITQDLLFGALLSSFPLMALAIGPINSYAVEIFPMHLRGMAVSLCLMFGRMGSIFGSNIAGLLINAACESAFYSFGGLLIFCGVLSFLLPSSTKKPLKDEIKSDTTRL